MKCFYKEQPNGICLIVENKFNPSHGRLCVHSGTKFNVLIEYFVENKQQDDSFHPFTIIKRKKQKHSSVYFRLNKNFSQKEIRS